MTGGDLVEVITAHRIERGHRDLDEHCTCGTAWPRNQTNGYATHLAEAIISSMPVALAATVNEGVCSAQYGSNPDPCYLPAAHHGPHTNRYGCTWAAPV